MKRFIAATLTMLTVLCSFPITEIHAVGDDYSRIMRYDTAGVFASVQPSSAISLESGSVVTIDAEQLSPNYGTKTDPNSTSAIGGMQSYIDGYGVDLPRLQASYYYELTSDTDKKFTLDMTMYPTLIWTSSVSTSDVVKISVKSHDNVNADLPTYNIRFTRAFTTSSDRADVTSEVVAKMIEAGGADSYLISSASYSPLLHKVALITSTANGDIYAYVPKGVTINPTTYPGLSSSNKRDSVNITEYDGYYRDGNAIEANLWDFAKVRGVSSTSTIVMAIDDVVDYATTEYSTGTITCNPSRIPAKIEGDYIGSYALAMGDRLVLGAVKNAEILTKPSISDISSSARKIEVSETDGAQSYISVFNRDDFNEFALAAENNYNLHTDEAAMNFTYTGTKDQSINVFADSFAFNGYADHIATLDLKASEGYTFTVNYQDPTSSGGQWKQMEPQTAQVGTVPNFKVPESFTDYEWENKYYSDSSCTQQVTDTMWRGYSKGANVIVYGKYNYVGGNYTVTFYNDKTASGTPTQESKVFPANQQPTLPNNPPAINGMQFARWEIVDTTASVSGIRYTPETFKPVKDRTYIFKAMWDVAGIITNVTNQKNDYNVGDTIDKAKLVVTVQTDSTGATRTLATNEYTVSPTTIQNVGENNVTVTYTATGSTYNIRITGASVNPQSITAQYTGGNLTVGTSIPRNNVIVTVHFSNGNSDTVTNFTLNPTTVQQVGSNTITVNYNSLTTTINVTGVAAETPNQPSDKVLSMLSARYIGGTKYVGDNLQSSDFQVVARYSDGTTETLGNNTFTFSPNTLRNAGSTVVGISYGGKSCSVSVNAVSRDNPTQGNQNGGTSGSSGSSSGMSGSNNGSSSGGNGSSSNGNNGTSSSNNSSSGSNNGSSSSSNNSSSSSSNGSSSSNSGSSSGSSGNNSNSSNDDSDSNDSSSSSGRDTNTSSIEVNPIIGGDQSLALGDGGDPTTGAGVPADKIVPSPNYIFGKTILDSTTMGADNVEFEQPDILAQILGAGESASDVSIKLLNGSANNMITSSMLNALQEKGLTLYITMLNPENTAESVGNWTVIGSELDNEEFMFDANISYQETDKGAEKLVFMGVGTLNYPKGMSLTLKPVTKYYNSGEVVRLYATNAFLSDSIYLKTINWSDYDNAVSVDLYSYTGYCMSNLPSAYPDGSDLTQQPIVTNEESSEDMPTEIIIDFGDGEDSEDESFDWGDGEDESFNWDDTSDDDNSRKPKISLPIILAIVGIGLLVVCVIIVVLIVMSRSAKRRGNGEDIPAPTPIPNPLGDGEEDFEEDFEELPGDGEPEVESFDDDDLGGED